MNFGAGSFMNGGCNYVDVCNTLPPSAAPITPEPTNAPITPAPTPCEAQKFFFDGNVCTNEFFVADAQSYNTFMACCNMNFGAGSFMNGGCNYVDVCNTLPPSAAPIEPIVTPSPVTPEPTDAPITPAPTPCEVLAFFFNGESCTNEIDFFMVDATSYSTAMACCNMNFGAGSYMNGSCYYVDICNTLLPSPSPIEPVVTPSPATPEPTDSPVTPAPTPCEALRFFFDGETCTNAFLVADATSYNTAMTCCNMNFGAGSFVSGSCNYVDVCNTLPPSPAPTFVNTPGSTPTVSKETTGPPTLIAGRDDIMNHTRDMPHAATKTLTNTECEPIFAGNPSVCVYVCTDIVSVYAGEVLISEDASSYETACPDQ
jgi:hypothetical protein